MCFSMLALEQSGIKKNLKSITLLTADVEDILDDDSCMMKVFLYTNGGIGISQEHQPLDYPRQTVLEFGQEVQFNDGFIEFLSNLQSFTISTIGDPVSKDLVWDCINSITVDITYLHTPTLKNVTMIREEKELLYQFSGPGRFQRLVFDQVTVVYQAGMEEADFFDREWNFISLLKEWADEVVTLENGETVHKAGNSSD
ncbi:hypothetical protein T440DRAFT_517744 [Plenodomus tracheiphilus IPT5]|uniref:Uncharacterized protein n=1 Tax=Plenodomus tracheiphilus IPT5 TaxID=1408161 RepID=A0A6A7B789_9PLEO|nr:hypothetical protein T440DRAFT_517744 [Plenodomus tracheiphilus IPT5]